MKNLKLTIGLIFLILTVVIISYFKVNKTNNLTKVSIENIDDTKVDTTYTELIDAPDSWIDSGKVIFRMHCAPCHSFTRDYSGPMITRKPGFYRMFNIIKSINDFEKSGDKYTKDLLEKWDKKSPRMIEFKDILNDDEINMLLSYIEYETEHKKCVH